MSDCISRQAAQDYIAKFLSQFLYDDVREAVETIDEYIGDMPSITPTVIDKIRAELHATAEMHEDSVYYLREEWIDEIIDKYKAESGDKG